MKNLSTSSCHHLTLQISLISHVPPQKKSSGPTYLNPKCPPALSSRSWCARDSLNFSIISIFFSRFALSLASSSVRAVVSKPDPCDMNHEILIGFYRDPYNGLLQSSCNWYNPLFYSKLLGFWSLLSCCPGNFLPHIHTIYILSRLKPIVSNTIGSCSTLDNLMRKSALSPLVDGYKRTHWLRYMKLYQKHGGIHSIITPKSSANKHEHILRYLSGNIYEALSHELGAGNPIGFLKSGLVIVVKDGIPDKWGTTRSVLSITIESVK